MNHNKHQHRSSWAAPPTTSSATFDTNSRWSLTPPQSPDKDANWRSPPSSSSNAQLPPPHRSNTWDSNWNTPSASPVSSFNPNSTYFGSNNNNNNNSSNSWRSPPPSRTVVVSQPSSPAAASPNWRQEWALKQNTYQNNNHNQFDTTFSSSTINRPQMSSQPSKDPWAVPPTTSNNNNNNFGNTNFTKPTQSTNSSQWDNKPPAGIMYDPRNVQKPHVQAGWGAPPQHTVIQQQHQPRPHHSWDTPPIAEEVVRMNDLSSSTAVPLGSGLNQRRFGDHTQSLRKVKSTASFFDSKNIARGRLQRGSMDDSNKQRLFTRQIDQVNRSMSHLTTGAPDWRSAATTSTPIVNNPARLYVYGFPSWVRVRELIDIFCDYGSVLNVGIMSNEIPPYAFVDFEKADSTNVARRQLESRLFFDMSSPLEIYHEKKTAHTQAGSGIQRRPSQLFDDSNNESTTIHLGNVPQYVQRSEIEKLFSQYGPLKRVQVVNRPKENRAFAFIGFRDAEGARNAMGALRNSNTLYFNMSEPLKMEYSKIEKRKLSERNSTLALSAAYHSANSSNIPSSPASPSITASNTPAGTSGERPLSSSLLSRAVYIQIVPAEVSTSDLVAAFTKFGPFSTHGVNKRNTPAVIYQNSTSLQEDSIGAGERFALFLYESEEDAQKAVDSKMHNCVVPRQRRLHFTTHQKDIAALCLHEVVKIVHSDEGTFDVEFSKAETALGVLLHHTDATSADLSVEYSSSIRKENGEIRSSDESSQNTSSIALGRRESRHQLTRKPSSDATNVDEDGFKVMYSRRTSSQQRKALGGNTSPPLSNAFSKLQESTDVAGEPIKRVETPSSMVEEEPSRQEVIEETITVAEIREESAKQHRSESSLDSASDVPKTPEEEVYRFEEEEVVEEVSVSLIGESCTAEIVEIVDVCISDLRNKDGTEGETVVLEERETPV